MARVPLLTFLLPGVLTLGVAYPARTQQPTTPTATAGALTRAEILRQVLPPGNYRNVSAVVIELGPEAGAPRHRHDVAVLAYVLEGAVENQFDGGAVITHRAGDSWWENPGTVHTVARNASRTARARLLVIYIGEEGRTATVPLN